MKVRVAVVASIAFLAPMISTAAIAFPFRIPPAVLIWGQLQLNGQAASPISDIDYTHQIQTVGGQTAKILCRGSLRTIDRTSTFTLDDVCPEAAQTIERDGVEVPLRGGNDQSIPFIISPRKTKLLSSRPFISWNAVETSDFYSVTLLGPEGRVWSRTSESAEMPYPSDESSLEEGVNYAIKVTTSLGVSSDEGIPGLAFSVMSQDEQRQVEMAMTQLSENGLTAEAKAYAEAYTYQNYGLLTEAITIFESLEQNISLNSDSYHFLGSLYEEVRLNYHARDFYLKALEIAEEQKHEIAKAKAFYSLGNIHIVLGNIPKAISYLEQSQEIYLALEGEESRRGEIIENQLSIFQ